MSTLSSTDESQAFLVHNLEKGQHFTNRKRSSDGKLVTSENDSQLDLATKQTLSQFMLKVLSLEDYGLNCNDSGIRNLLENGSLNHALSMVQSLPLHSSVCSRDTIIIATVNKLQAGCASSTKISNWEDRVGFLMKRDVYYFSPFICPIEKCLAHERSLCNSLIWDALSVIDSRSSNWQLHRLVASACNPSLSLPIADLQHRSFFTSSCIEVLKSFLKKKRLVDCCLMATEILAKYYGVDSRLSANKSLFLPIGLLDEIIRECEIALRENNYTSASDVRNLGDAYAKLVCVIRN